MTFQSELTAKAACPPGKRVIAGGYNLTGPFPRSLTVVTSFPETGDGIAVDGWIVEFRNNTSTNLGVVNVTAFATCVNK